MNKVFLSYRRKDSPGYAGRISDHIRRHLGSGLVFRDVDELEAGADFVDTIEKTISACRAFILVIGPQWNPRDKDGRARLDDPQDWVRREIAGALAHNLFMIPALVDGARMPAVDELPAEIAAITRRHAIELDDGRFESDVERLVRAVRSALGEGPQTTAGPMEPRKPELSKPEPPKPEPRKPEPPNLIPIRLMRSYMSVVLCFPLGCLAVVESNKCAAALAASDHTAARTASAAAQKWNSRAIFGSFVWWAGVFSLFCIAAVSGK